MKKFAIYSIAWAIVLGLFNLVAFISPAKEGVDKYTVSFFVAYGAITLAFILNLICSLVLFRTKTLARSFYSISLALISAIGMLVMLLVGTVFMSLPMLPYWIGIIVCYAVLGASVIAVLKAASATVIVDSVDHAVSVITAFVKGATAKAELLMRSVNDPALRACTVEVFEAFRYSDPVSDPALASIEAEIVAQYNAFAEAVKDGDLALAKAILPALLDAIRTRNEQAKALK